MNQISLIGRLTADPEYRAGEKHEAATFRLAVARRRGNSDAGAVFIEVVAFDKLASTVADHLAKGRQVAVAGRLEQAEWTTQEGDYRSKHQVIADEVMFLDAPKSAPAEEPEPQPAPKQGYQLKQYRRAG
ncbi:MAG: single-stranded DNA-binding protein [Actinobacteria bacterium]|nr:single-stranded DNA-binding protein [Actinomycetota bacterium]